MPSFQLWNAALRYTTRTARGANQQFAFNVNNVLGLNSDQGNSYTWPRKTEPRQYVTTVTTNF